MIRGIGPRSFAFSVAGLMCAALSCSFAIGCECGQAGSGDTGSDLQANDPASPDPDAPATDPLVEALSVSPENIDFETNPELLIRLRANPHNYFRFVWAEFAGQVCERFDDTHAPEVNLHGDAHLEQYAISDLGRGLTDFDGASAGPAFLDLVRMGTSIRLVAAMHGWEDEVPRLAEAFIAAYRGGVEVDTHAPLPPEPPLIARIRASFDADQSDLLSTTASLVEPLPEDETARAREAMGPYIAAQRAENPELDTAFFDLVSIGRLNIGIGSALDEKYLLRVRGPTDAPDDDVVLEAKEVHPTSAIPCVGSRSSAPDPFRILVGESRIAYRPFPYLGYMRARGLVFWIHAWTANYQEVSATDSLETPEDLRALVEDIGHQLGRGHVNQIAAPLDAQLRRAVLGFIDENVGLLDEVVLEMAAAIERAFRRFVEATDGP
ncbi:MAG: DUF2252 family protein [Sandaracinaceae bacterium]